MEAVRTGKRFFRGKAVFVLLFRSGRYILKGKNLIYAFPDGKKEGWTCINSRSTAMT